MPKKITTPLLNVKRSRTTAYSPEFDALKAEVLAEVRAAEGHRSITQVAIDKLRSGRYQSRSLADDDPALDDLVASIRKLGVIEPLAIRPLPEQPVEYEILAGHRRWKAAQRAGLEQVPVIIHEVDDKTAAAITLVENLQREDLNPIEEAVGLQRLMEDFALTQAQVGELVSKSESAVSKSLGLLKLLPSVQDLIRQGVLDAGHGKVLLTSAAEEQLYLAEKAVQLGWSVRQLERYKTEYILKRRQRKKKTNSRDADIRRLEIKLGEWFSTPVTVKPNTKGGGKIEITYSSAEQCEGILRKFGFDPQD